MVGSALLAHVAAGGALPPASVLAVLLSSLSLVGIAVAGGGLGRWTSLALVGGSEFVVHELLVATSHWSASSGPGHTGLCGDHGQAVLLACARAADVDHVAPEAAWTGGSDVRMLLLHAVATVTTGLLLAVAERIRAGASAAVRPLWGLPTMPPRLIEHPVARCVEDAPWVPAPSLVVARRRPRRGPPRMGGVAPVVPA